jgi:hypothetical protein
MRLASSSRRHPSRRPPARSPRGFPPSRDLGVR